VIQIIKYRGKQEIEMTKYGKYYFTVEELFDLTSDELSLFIQKKSDAPKCALRNIYQCQSNRSLISKIARYTLKTILWEIIKGKTFYFPNSNKSKIFIGAMNEQIASNKKKCGFYGMMNLYMSEGKIPQFQIYIGNRQQWNCCIYANREFFYEMASRLNETGKVGGKIPFRIEDIIGRVYDEFSLVDRSCVKLIIDTLMRRMKIICKGSGSLLLKDNMHYLKIYYPMSPTRYTRVSRNLKNRITKRLTIDKQKHFPKLPVNVNI